MWRWWLSWRGVQTGAIGTEERRDPTVCQYYRCPVPPLPPNTSMMVSPSSVFMYVEIPPPTDVV